MSAVEIVTLAFAALVLIAWYLTYTAARLHRLHTRAEGALAQLFRKADAKLYEAKRDGRNRVELAMA